MTETLNTNISKISRAAENYIMQRIEDFDEITLKGENEAILINYLSMQRQSSEREFISETGPGIDVAFGEPQPTDQIVILTNYQQHIHCRIKLDDVSTAIIDLIDGKLVAIKL